MTAAAPVLWVELWTSFASLLRTYAAAHGLNTTHQAIIEVGANEIVMRVNTKTLTLTQHDGNGSIEYSNGVHASLTLLEDGQVKIGDVTEEMDMAAERLAREMMV